MLSNPSDVSVLQYLWISTKCLGKFSSPMSSFLLRSRVPLVSRTIHDPVVLDAITWNTHLPRPVGTSGSISQSSFETRCTLPSIVILEVKISIANAPDKAGFVSEEMERMATNSRSKPGSWEMLDVSAPKA